MPAVPGSGFLSDYRILRRLGEGGMGAVYLGFDEKLQRLVAIKVLADHLAQSPICIDRFYREAKIGGLLEHPNLVRTLQAGWDPAAHKHFLVLEYVDGFSAHVLLDRMGALPVGDAIHITLDIVRALEYLHARNIVHRDIKPDNILITTSGLAKLSDLGLAKRLHEVSRLTAAHQGFGTSYYMPYEQAINARFVDGRSDLYALGATLYHLLTGEVPFPGKDHAEIIERKAEGNFTPAAALNQRVSPELDAILARMMARNLRDRYQTASDLIVDLDRSGLSAGMPSFVDLDRALQDPLVRARLTTTAQPTRPDLETPARHTPVHIGREDVWYLRYRDREGRWCKTRASTPKIVQRLKEGRLSPRVEASRLPKGPFQPLRDHAEFADVYPPPAPIPPTEPDLKPPKKTRVTGEVRKTPFGLHHVRLMPVLLGLSSLAGLMAMVYGLFRVL